MSPLRYPSQDHKLFLEALLQRVYDFYGPRLVSLAIFGSYARGENKWDSDLDLFIVLESWPFKGRTKRIDDFVQNVEGYLDQRENLAKKTPIDISPLLLNRTEAGAFLPLYLDMVEDRLILFDKDGFLENRLQDIRQKMARWGSRKRTCGGHWYWEIKPGLKWGEVIDYDE